MSRFLWFTVYIVILYHVRLPCILIIASSFVNWYQSFS